MTTVIRMLAYGIPMNLCDEYIKVGERTAIKSLKSFCDTVVALYAEQYLRSPNECDIARLLQRGEERGFPGMLGSIYCMHWGLKNCPKEWHGTHKGKNRNPTLILKAVASKNLWIWHAFFGMAGSHNDVNVLDHSPVCNCIINDTVSSVNYEVNGQAFGLLHIRCAITHGPICYWKKDDLNKIMRMCIILHNMIMEDKGDTNILEWTPPVDEPIFLPHYNRDRSFLAAHISTRLCRICNAENNGERYHGTFVE